MNELATSTLHQTFCDNIKSRRVELGLTQKDVAEKLGITQPTYAAIESGRRSPTLIVIERICRSLDISASEAMSEHAVAR